MDYVRKFLHVEGVIGQGAFGRVLATSPLENHQVHTYALKCIPPILRPSRLANELRCMRDLGGQCNVVHLHSAHLHLGSLYIVMELIEHDRFYDIVAHLEYSEIVMYMKNLLIALEHVHAHHIMHRDIKPANFLFNRKDKKFLLIDFGLATVVRPKSALLVQQSPTRHYINLTPTGSPSTPSIATKRLLPADVMYTNDFNQMLKKLRVSSGTESREPVKLTVGAYESPVTINNDSKFSTPRVPARRGPRAKCDCRGKRKSCATCQSRPDSNAPKSGTPGYKAPEILFRYPHQTTAVDIWSAGVILACLLFGHAPFFRDVDDGNSLEEIITVLGTAKVSKAAEALGLQFYMHPKREPVDIKSWCKTSRMNGKNKRPIDIPDAAFDLLYRMLDPNPSTRITASDALKHDWFVNP